MKAYICDHCGKHEQTDYNGLKPRGWFGLDRRNPEGGGHTIDLELCSPGCLVSKAIELAGPKHEEPAPTPVIVVGPDAKELVEELTEPPETTALRLTLAEEPARG